MEAINGWEMLMYMAIGMALCMGWLKFSEWHYTHKRKKFLVERGYRPR